MNAKNTKPLLEEGTEISQFLRSEMLPVALIETLEEGVEAGR